ncbi:MAG: hypothetical protein AABY22_03550 [Nanoarchaeota archaeon]
MSKLLIYKTDQPICKKCNGGLDSVHVVTQVSIDGGDIGEGFQLYCNKKTIPLYSCKSEKCKWFGLLTQIVKRKITTNKFINGSWNQESEEIK